MSASGVCECGCGGGTQQATRTYSALGLKRGDFRRFIYRHAQRSRPTRYYPVRDRTRVHRLLAERALGKPLPKRAEVHHADGSKTSITGPFVICENRQYHKLLHVRMRIKAAGGNPNTDKVCGHCKAVKSRSEFNRNVSQYDGLNATCRACANTANTVYRSLMRGVPTGG